MCVCTVRGDSRRSQWGGPCPTSCSSDHRRRSSGRSSCIHCGPALKESTQKGLKSTRGCVSAEYIILLCVPSTLNALYEVLLVGSDVQKLDHRVQRRDGRGFHHCCLFQAAYAGLWWIKNDIVESFLLSVYRKITPSTKRLHR